jgi:carboxyl-terminal processing protease
MASVVPMTLGDQGGLISGHIMGPGLVTMGNPTIFVNCVPAANLLVPTTGNAMNAFLGAAVVPSISTTFFTDKDALRVSAPGVDDRALEWLDGEVAPDPEAIGLDRRGDVLVARISRFTRNAASRVLAEVERAAARRLVLDLRGCPGGDLRAALVLVDELVPAGTALCLRLDAGDALDDATVIVARRGRVYDGEVVVVVDEATASAAELVAAILKYLGRARVLGARTAGKATVQTLVAAEAGARYATVSEVRLPDGSVLHSVGVEPDGPVESDVDATLGWSQ